MIDLYELFDLIKVGWLLLDSDVIIIHIILFMISLVVISTSLHNNLHYG